MLLLAEDAAAEDLTLYWKALEAVCGSIPKDELPEYVHCLKVRGEEGSAAWERGGQGSGGWGGLCVWVWVTMGVRLYMGSAPLRCIALRCGSFWGAAVHSSREVRARIMGVEGLARSPLCAISL